MTSGAKKKELIEKAKELRAIKQQAKERKAAAKAKAAKRNQKKQPLVFDDADLAARVAKRKRGVLVTASEAAEATSRLGLLPETAQQMASSSSSAEAASPAKAQKGGRNSKTPAKATKAAAAASPSLAATEIEEPRYSFAVHVKRKIFSLYVTLHRVPENAIDVDGTTSTQFVVDTRMRRAEGGKKVPNTFSKPYRLVFPFPSGMTVDSENAEYTLENGELTCHFPITNLPKEVAEQTEKMLESEREGRKKRFVVSKVNGEVEMRNRKVKWIRDAKEVPSENLATDAQLNKLAKSIDETQAKRARDDGDDTGEAPVSKAAKRKQAAAAAASSTGGSNAGGKAFVEDNEAMLKIAAEAGKSARKTLVERQKNEKARAQKKEYQQQSNAASRASKAATKKDTYSTILEKKRMQLQAMAAAMAPAPRKTGAKTVSFQ